MARKPRSVTVHTEGTTRQRQVTPVPPASDPSARHALVEASYQFTGPIPSPQDLAQYEAIMPGLADRLIERFERQSEHRMALEREVTRADVRRANLGLTAGFTVALTSIGASAFLVAHGHDVAGTVLGGATIVSLVSTFIYGTNSRKEERLQREKLLVGPDKPDKPQ